jgi:hypothetical protein
VTSPVLESEEEEKDEDKNDFVEEDKKIDHPQEKQPSPNPSYASDQKSAG